VNAAPEGTAFTLRAGVHRLQQFTPKSGQSFTGETGAVLSGARVLTDWTRDGSLWVHGGQTEQGEVRLAQSCDLGHLRCANPEDLFVDDSVLEHVGTLAEVRPGTWFFDYDADRVYMADDPTGKRVELSVLPYAAFSDASGITVQHLTIEKYAVPAQLGALGYRGPGPGWVIRDNEIRWNHGAGIRIADGMQIIGNVIHHQRQLGIGGSGNDVVVDGNEIAFNNTAHFGGGQFSECGGTKFVFTGNLRVTGNNVHHNHCNGLWTDANNRSPDIERNTVVGNDCNGIIEEVGYNAIIRDNIVRGNGFSCTLGGVATTPAGINISSSPNAEVSGNLVEDNANGITGVESERPSPVPPPGLGPHDVVNLFVHDNTIRQTDAGRAAGLTDNDRRANPYSAAANNRWTSNTYFVGPATRWRWAPNADLEQTQWRAAGQDSASVFN
jgi:hypothetical protein